MAAAKYAARILFEAPHRKQTFPGALLGAIFPASFIYITQHSLLTYCNMFVFRQETNRVAMALKSDELHEDSIAQ